VRRRRRARPPNGQINDVFVDDRGVVFAVDRTPAPLRVGVKL